MNAAAITGMMHSRTFAVVVTMAAAACACLFYVSGAAMPFTGSEGIALPSPNLWLHSRTVSFIAALIANGLTITAMLLLNKVYNVMRSMTSLFITLFACMQMATPDTATQFYGGSLLAVAVPACLIILFGCYKQSGTAEKIFFIFFVLSALSTTQISFAPYLVAFVVGMAQMRIFSLRSLLAAMMGALTPWIIILGYGVCDADAVRLPQFEGFFAGIDVGDTILLAATLLFTAATALSLYILNVIRTIAYNARARAFNGSFTIVSLITAIAMCADYDNILQYVPLFNFNAAMEMSHYFSTHRGDRTFIPIAVILAVYFALFICQTVI